MFCDFLVQAGFAEAGSSRILHWHDMRQFVTPTIILSGQTGAVNFRSAFRAKIV